MHTCYEHTVCCTVHTSASGNQLKLFNCTLCQTLAGPGATGSVFSCSNKRVSLVCFSTFEPMLLYLIMIMI